MEHAVAEAVARNTRQQAVGQAQADLNELRRRAVEAGRDRSRKLIKVTTISDTTGQIRHNPAGRVLRDWYLHVYINTLRARLGQPSEAIDAQQVEDMTKLLHRLRPKLHPHAAMQAVGVARNMAVADVADAVVKISEHVHEIGTTRTIQHAAEDRFDGDRLRVYVTRHWYKRCYDDLVDRTLDIQHPMAAVTEAEEIQVARTLATRQVRRLIGRDGIPLVNQDARLVTEVDRQLAAGEKQIGQEGRSSSRRGQTFTTRLEKGVATTWRLASPDERSEWLRAAGSPNAPAEGKWSSLSDVDQIRLLRHYLATHQGELAGHNFENPLVRGRDSDIARRMFEHQSQLTGPSVPASEVGRQTPALAPDDSRDTLRAEQAPRPTL